MVNSTVLSLTNTPILPKVGFDESTLSANKAHPLTSVPLHQTGTAEDVAKPIACAATRRASSRGQGF